MITLRRPDTITFFFPSPVLVFVVFLAFSSFKALLDLILSTVVCMSTTVDRNDVVCPSYQFTLPPLAAFRLPKGNSTGSCLDYSEACIQRSIWSLLITLTLNLASYWRQSSGTDTKTIRLAQLILAYFSCDRSI